MSEPVLVLPAGQALAPGDLRHRVERGEAGHQVGARGVPVAPRAAGEDRAVLQGPVLKGTVVPGTEHGVDVAGHARFAGARVTCLGRVVVRAGGDPRGRGLDHGGLVRGEEQQRPRLGFALRCGGAGGEANTNGDGGDERAATRSSGCHGSLLIMGSW